MNKNFESLIGFEGSVIEMSNKLQTMGCEDVCWFSNWDELLEGGNVIVAIETEHYEEHIQIYFQLQCEAGEDEAIEASIIKIMDIDMDGYSKAVKAYKSRQPKITKIIFD